MKNSGALQRGTLLLSILLFTVHPESLAAAPAFANQNGHTRITLVADVRSIRPGTPFTAGILLRMEKGWHTYWRNPGESGLPTELRWTLPPGFTAGPIAWPIPEKKVEEGDLLTYAYTGEVMLLVRITPPADIAAGAEALLRVDANWLECERTCVPGEGNATLAMPVRDAEPSSANESLFASFRATLPVPTGPSDPLRVVTSVEETGVILRVSAVDGTGAVVETAPLPDLYPYPATGLSTGRTSVVMEGKEAVIFLPLTHTPDVTSAKELQGVLVFHDKSDARRGIELTIPLEATRPADGIPGGGLLDRDFTPATRDGGQPSLWVYALFAVLGGLLLNVMPCVLPVIALKIFGLVKMAGDEPRRVRRLGWAFSAGILASFIALASLVILLKLAGQQVGWGFQFQEPVFVIIMSAVVFAFGLSLFGVFEIRLPGAAVAGVSSVLSRQDGRGKGYLASFSEGVFATILATPCTAPFLGSALGFAFAQPAGGILLIFSLTAFGMALPYLLLTARPAWLKYMPRPGEWMETAKQFMGFLMMATLLWLMYILGKQLGMEAVIWSGAFLLCVALAAWLVGRFATLSATRGKVYVVWAIAALIAIGGYWYFIETALDVRTAVAGTPGVAEMQDPKTGIVWEPFTTASLEGHLRAGRPVFLDFTAEWCLTCKVNERTVLHDAAVIERFRSTGIVAMKADWTNRNPAITKLLSRFGRSGVPLYVVFRAGDPIAPLVLPEVITTGIVLDALTEAVTARPASAH